jgi:hypothetical protein
MLLSEVLHRADKTGGAFKLLRGEQAERVAHEYLYASVRAVVKAPLEHREGGQCQVCLSLAAAGRKPDQFNGSAVNGATFDRRTEARQQERYLKRSPLPAPTWGAAGIREIKSLRECDTPSRVERERARRSSRYELLKEDSVIREPKRAKGFRVLTKIREAGAHPDCGFLAVPQVSLRGAAILLLKCRHILTAAPDPSLIARDDFFERAKAVVARDQAGQRRHRCNESRPIGAKNVRCDRGRFNDREAFGSNGRRAFVAISRVPVR